MWNYLVCFIFIINFVNANETLTYTTYGRQPATSEETTEFEKNNLADTCLVSFEPCDENAWRRPDGSCNNLKYPSHGSINTPEWRMLPANYSEGYEPRKMKSGKDFPLARFIRSALLEMGGGKDQKFSTAASYFLESITVDIVSIHDTENYVLKRTYCCEPEGLEDPMCVPNYIPENDDVHRFSGQRCINMTRPMTFQNLGCTSTNSTPSRVNRATAHWDLTGVYFWNGSDTGAAQRRTYEGGKLKVETVNGISLPSDAGESTTCFIKDVRETGCTRNVPNSLPGTNLFTIWFWRLHNYIADELAQNNPTLDDDTLYHLAMDINIAIHNQILMYELFPEILDKEVMINEGVINCDDGFRDLYNADIAPSMSTEYIYGLRWFHTTQDGFQKLYDKNHNLYNTTEMGNFSLGVELFAYDNNMEGFTNGLVVQPAGIFRDSVVHGDMANMAIGHFQTVLDIFTNDLAKGRYFGLAPYAEYRDFCTNYTIKHETFEDFKYIIDEANLEDLSEIYEDPSDIELLAGMWLEKIANGTWVPPTLHCIIIKQLKRTIETDRFWYERPNRPHAFNEAQLNEIRKASFANLLCTVGDDVLMVQPKAFLRIQSDNEPVTCDNIPSIDFSVWKDIDSDCSDNSDDSVYSDDYDNSEK